MTITIYQAVTTAPAGGVNGPAATARDDFELQLIGGDIARDGFGSYTLGDKTTLDTLGATALLTANYDVADPLDRLPVRVVDSTTDDPAFGRFDTTGGAAPHRWFRSFVSWNLVFDAPVGAFSLFVTDAEGELLASSTIQFIRTDDVVSTYALSALGVDPADTTNGMLVFFGLVDDVNLYKEVRFNVVQASADPDEWSYVGFDDFVAGEVPAEPINGAIVDVDSPLGIASGFGFTSLQAILSADGPLGSTSARAVHDFTSSLVDAPASYVMDLITTGGAVRVPIRSCQTTMQTGAALYAQCVVPAVQQWASTFADATEFALYRVGLLADGRAVESCLARHPLQTVQFAQGPFNYSATISGYAAALPVALMPFGPRPLHDVRATFITGTNYRIRCAPDWLIAPGHTVTYGPTSFVASYINHYATGDDHYIDVGQRSDD